MSHISSKNWEFVTATNRHKVYPFNSSPTGQNGRPFADDSFNQMFLNENVRMSIQFSLKIVPKVPIDNILDGLAPNKWQAITWTNAYSVNRRIYAALEGDELTNRF